MVKEIHLGTLILFFLPLSLFAQGTEPAASPGVSETLLGHILNSSSLELFPFLPALKLPQGITVHLFMQLLTAALLISLFGFAFRNRSLRPKKPAVALEFLILFVRDDIVYPVMGEERGKKWLPFFLTLFLFILALNLLGLIPAFKTATGNITVTTALALMVLVLILGVGLKNLGFRKFFRNMFPQGTPLPIGLFVAFLEFIGIFIKALVLSLRLFANMFAGHLAILSFLVLMFVLSPFFAVISLPFALFTYALEVLVALIQALVFTLLSCIFITLSSSVHEE